ncbi:MAG: RND transporter [Acidobacteria bacterium]|nr:MAG: RND transporter [Acidobacteriota bacterium]
MDRDRLTPLDRFAVAWTGRVIRRPGWVIAAALAAVLAAATGIPQLRFSNDYRIYFGPQNPELLAFEALQATYAKSDNVLFVVMPKEGEVFTPRVLAAIEELTAAAWQLPYASRVDSLTNFQHSSAEGDELTVADLVRGARDLGRDELAEKRRIALAEPALAGLLLSPDAGAAGVNAVFQFPQESLAEVPETAAAARALARRIAAEYPEVELALSGVAMLNNAFSEAGRRDAATLMPLMLGVLILFMLITLRSFWASVATLSLVALSATAAVGLAGRLGILLNPVAVTAPTIVMTLAIADAVHLLTSMLAALREGAGKAAAVVESVRLNFVAVVVTSLSTMAGFLSLRFSDAPPFHDLGTIVALGIAAALVLSLTFLPALLILLPIRAPARGAGALPERLDRFGGWIARHHRRVLAAAAATAAAAIGCMPLLELNDQWVEYFDRRVEFRRHAELTDRYLTGLYLVEWSLPAGEVDGVSDPAYLRVLEAFTGWLRAQPEVRHVASYADVVKRLNRNLHGDDEAYDRIPDERRAAAQYLLLYELSLPYGLDLTDRVAVDRSATRVTATLDGDVTTRETRALLHRAKDVLARQAPPAMRAEASGPGVMFARISQRNVDSMLRGNVLAVILIAAVMVLALRSLGLGLLSLVPNTIPILMTFGFWALVAGRVGMAGAMVSVSALGIVVDDTVHFLTKYARARRERGLGRPAAVRHAFRTVGSAIVSTTAILSAGFLALALSTFRINFELGLLTAIALLLALAADFTLLPALLLWGRRADESTEKEIASHETALARS